MQQAVGCKEVALRQPQRARFPTLLLPLCAMLLLLLLLLLLCVTQLHQVSCRTVSTASRPQAAARCLLQLTVSTTILLLLLLLLLLLMPAASAWARGL